jgi:hypothetical protein
VLQVIVIKKAPFAKPITDKITIDGKIN